MSSLGALRLCGPEDARWVPEGVLTERQEAAAGRGAGGKCAEQKNCTWVSCVKTRRKRRREGEMCENENVKKMRWCQNGCDITQDEKRSAVPMWRKIILLKR